MSAAWQQVLGTVRRLVLAGVRGSGLACRHGFALARQALIEAFWNEDDGGDRTGSAGAAAAQSREGGWKEIPCVARRLRARIHSSDPDRYEHFLTYTIDRWGGKLPRTGLRILCLGCSPDCALERAALQGGRANDVVVVEGKAERLTRARAAGLAPVRYLQVDLNRDPLPEGPYHVIVAQESLQRLSELEFVFDEVARVLDPIGQFAALEYLGPNRLQYSDTQMGMANAFLHLLPEHLRRDTAGQVRESQSRPDLGLMLEAAPDTAIRSEDLLGIMRWKLKVVDYVALGGTLLAPLLAGIAHNFLESDAEADRLLPLFIEIEKSLIDAELLPSDYGFVVARKPGVVN